MKLRQRKLNRVTRNLVILIPLALLLTGCNRGSTGISSGAGSPATSPQPEEVSSSMQVVTVEGVPVQIAEGGSAEAIVRLTIRSGYHVNANPATFPYLIPTEIERVAVPDGFCADMGKPLYPPAAKKKFDFEEEPLAVYEGAIEIKLPLRLARPTEPGCRVYPLKGAHGSVPITVRVQACDHEKCFPPATLKTEISIEVK